MDKHMGLLNFENAKWLDEVYARYISHPQEVAPAWRTFFEGMAFGTMLHPPMAGPASPELRIHLLIEAYRRYGHLMAQINPLEAQAPPQPKELRLEAWGLSPKELGLPFPTCGFLPTPQAPLQQIVEVLAKTYCGTIGAEVSGLNNPEVEKWLQQQIEPGFPLRLNKEERRAILQGLNRAELFETFLHTKFVGQKRFSLEGAETLIPMLGALIERGAEMGVEEVVIGMPHRGRLNVLVNILNRSYASVFQEFEDHYVPEEFEGTGDVKYHKGFTGVLPSRAGKEVSVMLVANASHLESVDPIVEGFVRGKQQLKKSTQGIVPLLIHGDAAIAGQGVIYETLQLSKLRGYSTGGTIHIVINNQIGFTTLPKDGRSTHYCTEVGRTFGAPIFHVNCEDPEGCVRVSQMAMEMRERFGCDVFIDLNCYRKYGHNESDEPAFTQPLEYALIRKKRPIRDIYADKLVAEGVLPKEEVEPLAKQFTETLHKAMDAKAEPPPKEEGREESASPPPQTTAPKEVLLSLAEHFCHFPEDLAAHPKVKRLFDERLAMLQKPEEEPSIDWGMGEHLALATLLHEGTHVRISGQDSRRGTFSHRHAIIVDQQKEKSYFPLSHVEKNQALFDIFNSPLSEFGVLGFEFGYSCTYPRSLTLWEAQFGDFANGGQVVIDQYIAASEQKWNLTSNLTLLLPHGYEGQGPEHSSARIERFLQLAGQDNLRIANCTTPAQLFHLLRLQALLPQKKPLILFTPKVLLRHPKCLSPLSAFTAGAFSPILDDPKRQQATRLLFCSGKIAYDLLDAREKKGREDIAIVRIEQLYPFPRDALASILQEAPEELFWVQEEPSNMGPWEFVRPLFEEILGGKRHLKYIGRERSASPAVASYAQHKEQLEEILAQTIT